MKIIQTFWSGNDEDVLSNNYGWLTSWHHLLGWILSVNQLRKYYDEVELFTDKKGLEILIEILKLPYTKVNLIGDEINSYPSELWALAKIKTYSNQETPFLHVDGDVFVWEKFSKTLLSAPLIAQNNEGVTDYYKNMWRDGISPYLDNTPEILKEFPQSSNGGSYNMGIFGGNDIEFIKDFAKKSMDFVNSNSGAWENINGFDFNIFFEQILLHELAVCNSKKVSCLINEKIDDNQYKGFGDFDSVPTRKKYLHLMGPFKRDALVCKKMETYILKHYPEYFSRLLSIKHPKQGRAYVTNDFSNGATQILIDEFAELVIEKMTAKKPFKMSMDINKLLIGRDLYMIDGVQKFKEYREKSVSFFLAINFGCQIKEEADQRFLVIREVDAPDLRVKLNAIDEIIFYELKDAKDSEEFIARAISYLEEDFPEDENESFINSVWESIQYHISLKALVPIECKSVNINSNLMVV